MLLVEVLSEGGGQGLEETFGFLLVDGRRVVDVAVHGPNRVPRLEAGHSAVMMAETLEKTGTCRCCAVGVGG